VLLPNITVRFLMGRDFFVVGIAVAVADAVGYTVMARTIAISWTYWLNRRHFWKSTLFQKVCARDVLRGT